jgi:hypothetical protein
MKIYDLTENFITEEQQLQELTNLFIAIGENHVLLSTTNINEISAWDAVKNTAGGIWRGVKTVDDAINKLGRIAQDTKPVQHFDNKSEIILNDLKNKISEDNLNRLRNYRIWAIKNPIKQSIILSIIAAVATLSMGAVGGISINFLLNFSDQLLKKEKVSTAIGQGTKYSVSF